MSFCLRTPNLQHARPWGVSAKLKYGWRGTLNSLHRRNLGATVHDSVDPAYHPLSVGMRRSTNGFPANNVKYIRVGYRPSGPIQ